MINLVMLILVGLAPVSGRAELQGVPAPRDQWVNIYRISRFVPEGVPCRAAMDEQAEEVRRFFFKEPFTLVSRSGDWVETRVGEVACWLPARYTIRFHDREVLCPSREVIQPLIPIEKLVDGPFNPDLLLNLGRLFPTFYMIAREEIFTLAEGEERIPLRLKNGDVIKMVTPLFRKAVMYQGTARLTDGRVVHYGAMTKRWGRTFTLLPDGVVGYGVAGHQVYPYRSAAVDFDFLCTVMPEDFECNRDSLEKVRAGKLKRDMDNLKKMAGSLLFIPRLMGVKMPDGSIHDGYVCAVDVGGGIKNNRIDLFVGQDGGGNPYYPPCQRDNPFSRAGVESLVPWDWRTWVKNGGEWNRARLDEFNQVSPHKGLEVFLVKGVRCRKVAQ